MKKILLFILVLSSLLIAQTPADKSGRKMLAGSVSLLARSADDNNDNLYSVSVSPKYFYFLTDRFAAGLIGNVNFTYEGEENESSLGGGPEIRYYPGFEKFLPFISAAFIADLYFDGYYTENKTTFRFGGGADFLITESIAFETILYLDFAKYDFHDNYAENKTEFGLSAGLSYFFE